jgi:hypothetical protein
MQECWKYIHFKSAHVYQFHTKIGQIGQIIIDIYIFIISWFILFYLSYNFDSYIVYIVFYLHLVKDF